MLKKVGLSDRVDYYPSGLSCGQQQRMDIVREVGDRVVFMHLGNVWDQGDSKTRFANSQTTGLKPFIPFVRALN
ncbi:hypothetical protein SAMN05216516_102212 [Izhakiella capsodis]|uniref:Uncharacterized protein n=1 Tax=Izhakiella capsodis TaxID=1367852 RepID=A0A1I4W0Z9_9GAMM|nr:hypothetical protein SAMN05216516_102212 [Izhakiella capsodis]